MAGRKGSKQGKLAQEVFKPGDIDAGGASAADRMAIIDYTEEAVLKNAEGSAAIRLGEVSEKIERLEQRLEDRSKRREKKAETRADKLGRAAAWRAVGVQERYVHADLPWWGTFFVLLILAALDFYIFAQAYAFVDDVADFSVQWWLGGILGLTVFLAGVVLARQLKTLFVSRQQEKLLHDASAQGQSNEQLVPLYASPGMLWGTGISFAVLCAAGFYVRIEGSDEGVGVLILQALIPLLVVVVELYLYDPLERYERGETLIDRLIRARQKKLMHRHDRMVEAYQAYVARTKASYNLERTTAAIIAADFGMDVTGERLYDPAARNGSAGDMWTTPPDQDEAGRDDRR